MAEETPPARIFISYTKADDAWARWADEILTGARHQTRSQLYDFAPGTDFQDQINASLSWADKVLSIVSERYWTRHWCRAEYKAAFRAQKLIPLRLDDCKLDQLYQDTIDIDVRSLDQGALAHALLAAVGHGTLASRSMIEPRFPGFGLRAIVALRRRNPHFCGRDALLERLRVALDEVGSRAPVALSGLGGAGKSEVALEFVHRYGSGYDAVIWLPASNAASLATGFSTLATQLSTVQPGDARATLEATQEFLARLPRALFVFDDVQEPEALEPYLPCGSGARVLVTTRIRPWRGAGASLKVDVFNREEALQFLVLRTGREPDTGAVKLLDLLGGLPLALEHAAAYVEECQITWQRYSVHFQHRGVGVLNRPRRGGSLPSVKATLTVSIQALAKHRGAPELLNLCSFLANEGLRLSDLQASAKLLPSPLREAARSQEGLDKLVAGLLHYSLASRQPGGDEQGGDDTLAVHPLVRQVVREGMGPRARQTWQQAALRLVQDRFPFNGADVRTWPECARLSAHAQELVKEKGLAKLDADAASTLCNRLAVYLAARGQDAEVEALYRQALVALEQNFGKRDTRVATVLSNYAMWLVRQDRAKEAVPLLRRAITIDTPHWGAKHLYVAIYLSHLGTALRRLGRYDEAEEHLIRAVQSCGRMSPLPPQLARMLDNLGSLLAARGRTDEAEPLLRRALAIDERSFGTEHPHTASDLLSLALVLRETGRLAEAELLCRRSLAIKSSALGDQHPETVRARTELSATMERLEQIRSRPEPRRSAAKARAPSAPKRSPKQAKPRPRKRP